jgi:hypothetical protein
MNDVFAEASATGCHLRNNQSGDRSALVLITAVWIAMILLVNPIGDFPLNDDWAYAWSVRTLLESGEFRLSDWAAVNLLPQVLWGALFCLPFGFSFTALRFSTLTLGLLGLFATYGVLREAKATPGLSLGGTLVVALNPIYFALANTFMSDVPSYTLSIGSFYFLLRALQRNSSGSLLIGVLLGLVSILNRQTGVLVFPAFACAYLFKNGLQPRSFATAGGVNMAAVAIYLGYPQWLDATGRAPHLYGHQTRLLVNSLLSPIPEIATTYAANLLLISIYLGLLLIPFLLVPIRELTPGTGMDRRSRTALLFLLFAAGVIVAAIESLPSVGNVLGRMGVGPSQIAGSWDPVVLLLWQVATVAAVLGAGILLRGLIVAARTTFGNNRKSGAKVVFVFAMATTVLYLLPIGALPRTGWFDRYVVSMLPMLIVVMSLGQKSVSYPADSRKWRWPVAASVFSVWGFLTVAATHDYLAWNRVRWEALDRLITESHVTHADIHGGFEFNGWFFAQRLEDCDPDHQRGSSEDASWTDFTCLLRRDTARYLVSPHRREGFTTEKQYTFPRWLPPRKQTLYVLRREHPGREEGGERF